MFSNTPGNVISLASIDFIHIFIPVKVLHMQCKTWLCVCLVEKPHLSAWGCYDWWMKDNHTKAYVNIEICKEHYLSKHKFGLNEKEII